MFYIFLDVDGVLNAESDWRVKFSIRNSCISAFGKVVELLRKKYEEVRVVICSTWRAGKSKTGEQDATQYIALKSKLKTVGVEIFGETPITDRGRQAEIEYYIRRNDVHSYIVIDDDPSLFDNISSINIYVPDYKTGLIEKDIKNIIKASQ